MRTEIAFDLDEQSRSTPCGETQLRKSFSVAKVSDARSTSDGVNYEKNEIGKTRLQLPISE